MLGQTPFSPLVILMDSIEAGLDNAAQVLADERRASVRYLCDLETACQPLGGDVVDSWPARALDISAGGVALVLGRRFEPGALLTVRLETADGKTTRTMLVRVVHTTQVDERTWRLGCALAGQLGQEELRAFQAECVQPTLPDCRAWVRFACDVETPCHAVAGAQPGTWSARVLDVSPGGMSLLVPCQFERGALLKVELPGSTKSCPQHVLVRVLRERPFRFQLWILGCELADQISDEDLRRFQ
jgi:hypothetical protein